MTDSRERIIFVKFSTSRSRYNSMKTVLSKKDGDILVRKIPLFPEAGESLQDMYNKKDLLPSAFPKCGVCACEKKNNALAFEYIYGNSLGSIYWNAFRNNDLELFYSNIERHKALLLSNPDNCGFFVPTDEYSACFGTHAPYEGLDALKCSNFEATAFNIILEDHTGKPIFFDYECIYDFPVPMDLVKYHCIYRTLYLCMPFLKSFVSPQEFLDRLDLQTNWKLLEKSWKYWRNNFSFGVINRPSALKEPVEPEEAADDDMPARLKTSPKLTVDRNTETAPQKTTDLEDSAEVYVTLAAIEQKYAKRIYEVTDLSVIRTRMRRRQKMKQFLKTVLPAPVFRFLKRIYKRTRRQSRKRR